MAEETKTVSIRLPQDVVDYLSDKGESVTRQILQVVTSHKAMRMLALNELRGVFTPEEWQFIAASLNGLIVTDDIRFRKDAFIWNCEDYRKYNPAEAGQWPDVTPEILEEKVKNLSGLHISAIYDRVEDFWENCSIDLAEWSKF